MSSYDFLVNKADLSASRLETADTPAPETGELLLRIDRFALTANNITYGVAGDMLGYWQFFPAAGDWGRIPVWGIGTALESRAEGVTAGGRYYGYYPMSGRLLVKPGRVGGTGFADQAEHRQALPPVYNGYALMNEATGFPPRWDNHQIVYRPLFTTSFVLDDYFSENDFFGAEQVVVASASSKTAFGTAFLLRERPVRLVGLTSVANRAFVEGLGLYDDVASYDEVAALDVSLRTAYVDMSGNRAVLAAVHHHFGNHLVSSCSVGITHRNAREGEGPVSLPGAKPALFFAPTQIQKRHKDWGAAQFQQRLGEAWQSFLGSVDDWVTIVEKPTPECLQATYETVLGGAAPDRAYVLTA